MADKPTIGFKRFGLVSSKPEGEFVIMDPGEIESQGSIVICEQVKTRWIEMCYDPSEDVTHLEPIIETISQLLDSKLISSNEGNITEDDVYLIIKSIANKFINDTGF